MTINGGHVVLILAAVCVWSWLDWRRIQRRAAETESRDSARAAAWERAARAGIAPRSGQVTATQVACPVELEDAA